MKTVFDGCGLAGLAFTGVVFTFIAGKLFGFERAGRNGMAATHVLGKGKEVLAVVILGHVHANYILAGRLKKEPASFALAYFSDRAFYLNILTVVFFATFRDSSRWKGLGDHRVVTVALVIGIRISGGSIIFRAAGANQKSKYKDG